MLVAMLRQLVRPSPQRIPTPDDLNAIPRLCDYAIGAVLQMGEFAEEAESKLAEVKKNTERRIQEESSDGSESQTLHGQGELP